MRKLLGILLLVPSVGLTQSPLPLPEFEVVDSSAIELRASLVIGYDSMTTMRPQPDLNLTDLLARIAPMNFKNYGPGLLSTPTFRGGDANHTQVLWNGMRLNSPMLGSMDFSTIPVSQFTELQLLTSSSSNLYTSGGIGGSVALQQQAELKNTIAQAGFAVGSYGLYQATANLNVPFKLFLKSALAVKIDAQSNKNTFEFTDISMSPYERKKMQDAAFNRANASIELRSLLSSRLENQLIYWYSETDRSIPAPLIAVQSPSTQNDLSHRAYWRLKFSDDWISASSKLYLESTLNGFKDERTSEEGENIYQQAQHQSEVVFFGGRRVEVTARQNVNYTQAQSLNYRSKQEQWVLNEMLFGRVQPFSRDLIMLEAGFRYEQMTIASGLLPFGGLTVHPLKTVPIEVFASTAQTLRQPTLNELYWNPGGNPDLLPESATTIESGMRYAPDHLEIRLVGFKSQVKNRIRWLPQGQVFSPINVAESEVLGADMSFTGRYSFREVKTELRANVEYIKATGNDIGQPAMALSYIPEMSGNLNTALSFRGHGLNVLYQYVSERFINSDESAYLPQYHLLSAGISEKFRLSDTWFIFGSLWANNLLNWEYQSMPWRPMPGRTLTLKISVRWEK